VILSSRIWEITDNQWKHCNNIEHGDDKNNEWSKEINKEIDNVYESIPPMRHLPATSRHFFRKRKVRYRGST